MADPIGKFWSSPPPLGCLADGYRSQLGSHTSNRTYLVGYSVNLSELQILKLSEPITIVFAGNEVSISPSQTNKILGITIENLSSHPVIERLFLLRQLKALDMYE